MTRKDELENAKHFLDSLMEKLSADERKVILLLLLQSTEN